MTCNMMQHILTEDTGTCDSDCLNTRPRRKNLLQIIIAVIIFILAICVITSLCFLVNKYHVTKPTGNILHKACCGDWIPFRDQKCIKILDGNGSQTKEEADLACLSVAQEDDTQQVAKLIVIKTEEKQKFIQDLLFKQLATFDNLWLGLEVRQNNSFKWNDGTELIYTNWANQSTIDNDRQCVQMVSGKSVYQEGQWIRANCTEKNTVLCEKEQTWTVLRLQGMLVSLKLEVEKYKKEWDEKNTATKQEAEENIKASKLENVRNLIVNKQELVQQIKAVKQDADQRINAFKQDADQRINVVKQDADQRINNVKQDADQRINNVKKETYHILSSSKQEAINNLTAVKEEAEEMIKTSILETERKLNANKEKLEENTIAVNRRINAIQKDTDQKLSASKQEFINEISAVKQEAENKFKAAENKANVVKQEADQKISNVIKNPVPIGFTYVQLPDQAAPSKIWPQVTWKDVSTLYAGLFFRVTGGNAAPFGRIQEENSPRLTNVRWTQTGNDGSSTAKVHRVPSNGAWSSMVFSGDWYGSRDMFLQFQLSTGEIRPRNRAIVIWKRVV